MTIIATPTQLRDRIGLLLFFMAGAIAVTPLVLVFVVRHETSDLQQLILTVAAVAWFVALVLYRGLSVAHARWRRKTMREEMAATRRARLDSAIRFEDKLNEQHAILERIADISETLVSDGIVDPQLALDNIDLISSHAREAQAQVEDTIIETRVECGSASVDIETFNVRDEIEDIVVPFIRSGIGLSTNGPRLFAATDSAMFRLMVRGLITSAAERKSEAIDVTVARNGDTIVCTVSDNGFDTSHTGLSWVSPVTKSIAHTVNAELNFSRALGRNQYSVAVPAGQTPEYAKHPTLPLDVRANQSERTVVRRHNPSITIEPDGDEVITFLRDQERDLAHTIAARRVRDLASR